MPRDLLPEVQMMCPLRCDPPFSQVSRSSLAHRRRPFLCSSERPTTSELGAGERAVPAGAGQQGCRAGAGVATSLGAGTAK